MACHIVGAKPLSEPMLPYCQLDIHENALKDVVGKMVASMCKYIESETK